MMIMYGQGRDPADQGHRARAVSPLEEEHRQMRGVR